MLKIAKHNSEYETAPLYQSKFITERPWNHLEYYNTTNSAMYYQPPVLYYKKVFERLPGKLESLE